MMLKRLRAEAGVHSLLSGADSNPKVAKNQKVGVYSTVLHLAPADMSGFEVCPGRSPGCTAACLHYAGSPVYRDRKDIARVARTKLLFNNRDLFMNLLVEEIRAHERAAKRRGMQAAVRLNGTSDIIWERKSFRALDGSTIPNIISLFPDIEFYDYTAILSRLKFPRPSNYHLTFSLKENNEFAAIEALNLGYNVAVVFFDKELPARYQLGVTNLPVIDGDLHDFRPLDPNPCVVGLKAKGSRGKNDMTGFVRYAETSLLKLAA